MIGCVLAFIAALLTLSACGGGPGPLSPKMSMFDGAPGVNAGDRIGTGPWFNQQGTEIAASLDVLHSDRAGISYRTALTEQGRRVPANVHDMLTGSNAQGLLATSVSDTTCRGWTSNAAGRAMLGHSDGSGGQPHSLSWNAAHISDGCSPKALDSTGGSGRFYCFAID